MTSKLIAGIILLAIGILFSLNNKNMAKGAAVFYKKFYTKNNLTFMFRAAGVILIVGGMIILTR